MTTPPQLYFIAGPNGAGKSTFSKTLTPPGALIFDPDKELALIEKKYANLPQHSISYAFQQHFQDFADLALKKKQDFVIETNFRDNALLDTAERFRTHGYDINMVYLVLNNIPESMARVSYRVDNGGHFVDDDSIRINYTEGLINLDYFADRFDNLEIIDASGSYLQLMSLLSVRQQKLVYKNNFVPQDVAQIVDRLADRYRGHSRDDSRGDSRDQDNDEEQGLDYTLGR
jgi:predicted ABC-type ATPase